MIYTYIALHGFKRLMLNQINHFTMTLNNPMQVIIGKNGSGKSSILQQLTPLPPDNKDFIKLGSKEIHILHNQSKYVLKSIFNPSQKHSFIQDEIELNEGGTITVQRELVKEHFGITNDIHSLILGEESFTDMSPAKRKEWLLKLCDNNYDYAVSVYLRLKKKHRDINGALEVSRKKLLSEIEKELKSEEELKLKNEIHSLHEFLSHLLEYRKPLEIDQEQINLVYDENLSQLNKLIYRYLQINDEMLGYQYVNSEVVKSAIDKLNTKLIQLQTKLDIHHKTHETLESKIKILRQTESETLTSLQETILTLAKRLKQHETTMFHVTENYRAEEALSMFLMLKNELIDLMMSIPDNSEKQYSSEQLKLKETELSELTITKQKLIEKKQNISNQLKHMNEHKDNPNAECPKCNHKFSLEYNAVKYAELEQRLESIEIHIEKTLDPKINIIESYLQSCREYGQLYRQFHKTMTSVTILKPYWDYLIEHNAITHEARTKVNLLNHIEQELNEQIKYRQTVNEYNEKKKLYHSLKDVGNTDLNEAGKQFESILIQINDETNLQVKLIKRKEKLVSLLKVYNQFIEIKQNIEKNLNKQDFIYKENIELIRRETLNHLIKLLQSELAEKESILFKSSMQKNIIEHIQKQITDLEKEEKALSVLVKTISPTEGLIAEGLYGFIRSFVKQMNTFIESVWNYPLEILPCQFDESETVDLDYKFPLRVNSQAVPIPDISKGSKGMLEIINIVFKIIAMRCLNLSNTALILDEPGTALDHEHRNLFILLIKSLMEQQTFKQIFLVSHFFEQYSFLSNTNLCVLSQDNVIIPKGNIVVNQNVTFG